MQTTCLSSKDNAKSNDSDHIFVSRENTHLKHRCPFQTLNVFVALFSGTVRPTKLKPGTHGQWEDVSCILESDCCYLFIPFSFSPMLYRIYWNWDFPLLIFSSPSDSIIAGL